MRVPSHSSDYGFCYLCVSPSYNSKTDAKAELGSERDPRVPRRPGKHPVLKRGVFGAATASNMQRNTYLSQRGLRRGSVAVRRPGCRRGAQQAPNPSPLENLDRIEPLGEGLASFHTKSQPLGRSHAHVLFKHVWNVRPLHEVDQTLKLKFILPIAALADDEPARR